MSIEIRLVLTPENDDAENPALSEPGAGESVLILGVDGPFVGRPSMNALATFSELSSIAVIECRSRRCKKDGRCFCNR